MRYRMLGGACDVFQLNASSGVVSIRAVREREEAAEYQLLVEASDQGRNPGPLSATATVYIEVEDENENYPSSVSRSTWSRCPRTWVSTRLCFVCRPRTRTRARTRPFTTASSAGTWPGSSTCTH
uniref:cadherin EGF LAG seven-pass G-type receptor 1-like n=1 Tax=Callithrix jacchus TaxID=9483 RepID=UPI0023DD37A0|nr:cadherin EGF LAG seven-pass G-type receptor 1-like [Callithrix jacchus]